VLTLRSAPVLLVSNPLHLHTAERAARPIEMRVQGLAPGEVIARCLQELGVARGRIGVAAVRNVGRASMPSHHFDVLRAQLPEAEFVDATGVFARARDTCVQPTTNRPVTDLSESMVVLISKCVCDMR
jgi:hypothetical protein